MLVGHFINFKKFTTYMYLLFISILLSIKYLTVMYKYSSINKV